MFRQQRAMADRREKGFSLIEMAIVLVIIGLIVTAVTVGKNTMRSAEMNKLYTAAVGPWIQAIYAYNAKMGTRLVCDATTAPKCVDKLTSAGLLAAGVSASYAASDGSTKTLSLTSVADKTSSATASTVTLTDTGLEGLYAVKGYVNGTITEADKIITFDLTQFAGSYGGNL